MLTPADIQAALQAAVFAVVLSDILTRPRMLFARYGRWLERMEVKCPAIAYPLGYCAKCAAGQVALWSFLLMCSEEIARNPVSGIIRVVCGVCLSILAAAFLSLFYSRLTR